MTARRCLLAASVAAAFAAAPFGSAAQKARGSSHAHEHGTARLGVAVEGRTVTLVLEAPLDGLLGFERAPRTDVERRAVQALRARLAAPADLFRFDPAAGCTLAKSEASSPLFDGGGSADGSHADLDATFTYECSAPRELKGLDVGLFAAYPRLGRIAVDVAGEQGQSKRDLRRPASRVALSR